MSKDFIGAAVQSGCLSFALYSLDAHDETRPDGTPARSAPRQLSLFVAHWTNSQAAFWRSGVLFLLIERLQFETCGRRKPFGPAGMAAWPTSPTPLAWFGVSYLAVDPLARSE